jgi:UDP-N-acetylglucosamine 4,6-dehydratase
MSKEIYKNKTILITGGTGSFGKNFIKRILKDKLPFKKIIIFSRDELKQHEMKLSEDFDEKKYNQLRFFIGDVRDRDRLSWALKEVDYVIHAAALKQILTGEYNPFEAIKTNVLGSQNIIDAALNSNVKKVIALSTDKAVSPVNLYGATKLCSDKLFISSNNIKGEKKISFSVVRYGNVTGSRGSVIPEFLKQKKHGNFLVTEKSMTRFNISLESAIEMVLWALKNSIGGEVIIPKLKAFRVVDLAKAVDPTLKIEFTGVRPGEKIHEELISVADNLNTYDIGKYYILLNQDEKLISFYKKNFKAKRISGNFNYTSEHKNTHLNNLELKKIIKEYLTEQ